MRRIRLGVLILCALLLGAGQALAFTLTEDFTGATINQSDLTTSTGLNQWNDLMRWQVATTGGNPDAWAQHTPRSDLGPEESLLFYGFSATGLGAGTPYSLDFDYLNGGGSFTGQVYLGGLSGGQSLSRFAPWPYLGATLFTSDTIGNNVDTWSAFSTLSGVIPADYDVLYVAFQMGGTDGLRGIDNVELQVGAAPVPEPGTLLLLGAGLLGLAFVGLRRRES